MIIIHYTDSFYLLFTSVNNIFQFVFLLIVIFLRQKRSVSGFCYSFRDACKRASLLWLIIIYGIDIHSERKGLSATSGFCLLERFWVKTKEAAAGWALQEHGRLTVCTVIVSALQKSHTKTCGPSERDRGGTIEQVLPLETVITWPLLSHGRGRSADPQGHVPDSELFSPGLPCLASILLCETPRSRWVPVCDPWCDPSLPKILKAERVLFAWTVIVI